MRASEWRERARRAARQESVELELPSGMKILARRPDPLQLAAWGRLPFSLSAAVDGAGKVRPEDVTEAEVEGLAGFLRDLLVYCCVEPRVSLEPKGEDEIHPREIPHADWTYIVSWALRVEEARQLEGFRGGRTDAGGGGGGEGILVAAI